MKNYKFFMLIGWNPETQEKYFIGTFSDLSLAYGEAYQFLINLGEEDSFLKISSPEFLNEESNDVDVFIIDCFDMYKDFLGNVQIYASNSLESLGVIESEYKYRN